MLWEPLETLQQPQFDLNSGFTPEVNLDKADIEVSVDDIIETLEGPAKSAIKEILDEPAMEDAIDELTKDIVVDYIEQDKPIEKPAVADFLESSLSEVMEDPVPLLQDFIAEVKQEV